MGSESVREVACAPAWGLTMNRDTPPSIEDDCGSEAWACDDGKDGACRRPPWVEARLLNDVMDSFRREASIPVAVPMAEMDDIAGGALDNRDWLNRRFAMSSGSCARESGCDSCSCSCEDTEDACSLFALSLSESPIACGRLLIVDSGRLLDCGICGYGRFTKVKGSTRT